MKTVAAVLSVLIVLWNVIGVGFFYSTPVFLFGDTSVLTQSEPRQFTATAIPGLLSAATDAPHYQSMVFVGDVLLARNVEFLMRTKGGQYPFAGIDLTSLGVKPAVIGNFEAAVPREHQPTPIGMIDFSVATTAIPYLSAAGYTHLSLSNNHSGDFAAEGFAHTVNALEAFTTFGHYNETSDQSISYVQFRDKVVSLIGLHTLHAVNDDDLRSVFATANRQSDLQIVYVHWGEEYAERQNDNQRKQAARFVELGADVIIGHHPHVVQGIELIDDVPVFYSLGNYIFDQYFSTAVQEGLVLSLYESNGMKINLIPVTSKAELSQPQFMNPTQHGNFLNELAAKSDEVLRADIINGYIMIDVQIASSDKVAMMQDTKKYVQ